MIELFSYTSSRKEVLAGVPENLMPGDDSPWPLVYKLHAFIMGILVQHVH